MEGIVTTSAAAADLDVAAVPGGLGWEVEPCFYAVFDCGGDVAVSNIVQRSWICGSDGPGGGFGDVGKVCEGGA